MNDLQKHKQTSYMTNQKTTALSVGRSIATLNNDLSTALEHQAYARKNPDENVDSSLLAAINVGVDELLSQFAEVEAKQLDVLAVKAGDMTVDELISKYNIDLIKYSTALI